MPGDVSATVRIATVYLTRPLAGFPAYDMAAIRWLRISESLARLGFAVDMIVNHGHGIVERGTGLRFVAPSAFRWRDYDVIKTLFHEGFETLERAGGDRHPFIVSKLGSVVGRDDTDEGVHFTGAEREALYAVQQRIVARSRYVTVLTRESRHLWVRESGRADNVLLVPTGVDRDIPPPGVNPYARFRERIAVYIGYLYDERNQVHVNRLWQRTLNDLGRALRRKQIRLCVVGAGGVDALDPDAVTYLGRVPVERIWDYHYFAHAGVALAQGPVQHNESSKLYYYLRAGLPVVSEAPIPNNHLIDATGLGSVVPFGDTMQMAEMLERAAGASAALKARAMQHMVDQHTWDSRARVYQPLFGPLAAHRSAP
jgi:hypothetical protein